MVLVSYASHKSVMLCLLSIVIIPPMIIIIIIIITILNGRITPEDLFTLGGGLGLNPVLWWERKRKQKTSVILEAYLKPIGF